MGKQTADQVRKTFGPNVKTWTRTSELCGQIFRSAMGRACEIDKMIEGRAQNGAWNAWRPSTAT